MSGFNLDTIEDGRAAVAKDIERAMTKVQAALAELEGAGAEECDQKALRSVATVLRRAWWNIGGLESAINLARRGAETPAAAE